jgi:hypothetical protein
MPFYTDSGEAIIPKPKPKQTTPVPTSAPKPTVTVKTKYFRPRSTSKPKPTPSPAPAPTPTTTKSPLSIKETVFKEPDRPPTQAVTHSYIPPDPSPSSTTQIVKDMQSGITPIERQIIDQAPAPTIFKQDGNVQPYDINKIGVASKTDTRKPVMEGETHFEKTEFSKHEGIERLYLDPSDKTLEVSGQYRDASSQLKDMFSDPTKLQTVTDDSGKKQLFPSTSLLYTIPTDSGTKTVPYPIAKGWAEQTSKEYEKESTELSSVSFDLLKQGLEAKREWHPDTEVIKKTEGYEVKFPYAGAESYGSYKRGLDKAGFFGNLGTSLTPEDPLGITSLFYNLTGERQKAIDVKVKAMHRTTVIKEAGGIISPEFAKYWFENPATQIGMAVVGGYGIGKLGTYAAGRVSGSVLATRALQIGGLSIGAALAAPAVIDIHSTWKRGDTGEAVGKLGMLGVQVGAGYSGYKMGASSTSGLFGRNKGLTAFEAGAKKAYVNTLRSGMKSGDIDLLQGVRGIRASQAYFKIKADIRMSNLRPFQAEPSFTNIQTLEKTPGLRNWFKQHSKFRKSEIFGGAASEKVSTHDIDIMYRSALGKVETGYASTKLGYGDVGQYADIKMWQRPGSIVSKMGTTKISSYKHPSGLRTGQFSEQFFRLGESSLNLAHSGRAKDIPGAIRMLDMIYGRTGGISGRIAPTVESYKFAMGGLEKTPMVMEPALSAKIYGTSWGKKWYGFKTKFYEKVVPEFFLKGKVKKFGISSTTPVAKGGFSYLPPSPSISFMPSSSIGGMASASFALPVQPSVSVSKSVSTFGVPAPPSVSSIIKTKSASFIKSLSGGKSKVSPSVAKKSGSLDTIFPSIISHSTSRRGFPLVPYQSVSTSKPIIPSSVVPSPPSYSVSPILPVSISSSVSKVSKSISKSFAMIYSPPVASAYIPLKLGGRGSAGWGDWGVGKKYRFREFKVASLEKLLGG